MGSALNLVRSCLARTAAAVLASVLTLASSVAAGMPPATAPVDSSADPIFVGFVNPPASARPRVWWHWVGGNISKDGIAKDLEWMKRVGIGGLQNFDVGLSARQVVDHRLEFMTPEWKEAFHFAAATADRLGLEMAVASAPGWSETGGPWVKPRDGMKKLVWSETQVPGGKHFRGLLVAPPSITGPYQDLAASSRHGGFYADAMVLAYPDGARVTAAVLHFATGAAATVAAPRQDQKLPVTVTSDAPGEPAVLVASFDTPQTVRSATVFIRDARTMFTDSTILPRLEARDASGWREVGVVPLSQVPTTISFAAVTAREFRLVMNAVSVAGKTTTPPPRQVRVTDMQLSPEARVDKFELKAGFDVSADYYALGTDATSGPIGAAPATVIDLTSRMSTDGLLDWSPPPGQWRVLRLGYSLLGVTNHPATPEATGLEVDKYDATVVRSYMDAFLEKYRDAAGPGLMGARGVQAIVTDSIEIGASNWTPHMVEQFQRLRGYDPRPWIPTLTGVIIGSRAQSDAFLYDFRRTLADLIASEHYGQVARSAHNAGLKVYGESLEGGRPSWVTT